MESKRRAPSSGISPRACRPFSALLLPALLAGCTAQHSLSPLDATHPASPEAAEAPLRLPSTTLESAKEEDHEMGSAGTRRRAGATVYACPMHPDVRQPSPGRCPKCGMALVKGSEAGGTQGGGHAD